MKDKVVPMVSKVSQMKAFIAAHKGDSFNASGLAKALGWAKKKTKKIKGEDGKTVEDVVKISYNSKAVVRLAKKCGANVMREVPPPKTGTDATPRFTIQM